MVERERPGERSFLKVELERPRLEIIETEKVNKFRGEVGREARAERVGLNEKGQGGRLWLSACLAQRGGSNRGLRGGDIETLDDFVALIYGPLDARVFASEMRKFVKVPRNRWFHGFG